MTDHTNEADGRRARRARRAAGSTVRHYRGATREDIQIMAARLYERTRREQGLPPHLPADSATADRLVDLFGLLDEPESDR